MNLFRRKTVAVVAAVVGLLFIALPFRAADPLPAQLSDQEFWRLVTDFSEPDGDFLSDNYVSNERSFQRVLAELPQGRQPASAYVGVGPEQNFTYILGVQPKIAFIVDIRRGNMLEHLMYKSLFELSGERAEFLSRLFSRARPRNLGKDSTVEELFKAFAEVAPDAQLFEGGLRAIKDRLVRDHGFKLTREDEASIDRIFSAFRAGGPNLTYNGPAARPGGIMPTFREIMEETDQNGMRLSFLASEERFQVIRELQRKNLLIPVVGDFAGPRALRAVGQYLRDHNASVTAFYTSNVEQYLFMNGVWKPFYANVSTLPLGANSVIVRGLIRSATGEYSASPLLPMTSRYETKLFPIADLVSSFAGGTIENYGDILNTRPQATPR